MRFSRSADDSSSLQTTLRTAGTLAARVEMPCHGAWQRLYAGPRRRASLEQAFSTQAMQAGSVFGIAGPAGSGKSAAAMAVCDLRKFRAVFASDAPGEAAAPQQGICVIIDSASAFEASDVKACVNAYRQACPVILVDRSERALQAALGPADTLIRLKLPSGAAIAAYLAAQMDGYQATLSAADYAQLGDAMQGMSLPQVNQVAVDAALMRLQNGSPVDRGAFDEALQAHAALRAQAAREETP